MSTGTELYAMDSVLTRYTFNISNSLSYQIEQKVSFMIQPRPRYIPIWLWERILKMVLTIAYHPQITKEIVK